MAGILCREGDEGPDSTQGKCCPLRFVVRSGWTVANSLLALKEASVALVAITYSILALVCFMIALAMPKFRRLHHDSFEMVHRFMGWSATALLWAQTVLLVRDYKDPFTPLHVALRQTPAFWLVVILTASIASSWMHLKRVKVESKQLSNHALLMHFDYDTPIPGSFARVSDSILTEWHSFATIATPGQKGYSMIVSRAGDWTSKKIAEPPSHIWVRGVVSVRLWMLDMLSVTHGALLRSPLAAS